MILPWNARDEPATTEWPPIDHEGAAKVFDPFLEPREPRLRGLNVKRWLRPPFGVWPPQTNIDGEERPANSPSVMVRFSYRRSSDSGLP